MLDKNTMGICAYVTNGIIEHVTFVYVKTIDYLFPLYLYPKKDNPQKRSSGSTLMLFEPPGGICFKDSESVS